MLYGIIGSGNVGATLASLIIEAGDEVLIANSRGPESLEDMISSLGKRACAATVVDAIERSDAVIEAIPFGAIPGLADYDWTGKVLMSAANYYPDRDGKIDLSGKTQSEWVADQLEGVRLVKAFNTIYFEHLADEGDPLRPIYDRRVLPFVTDDSAAAGVAYELIDRLGFGPLDLGPLAAARGLSETDGLLYNKQISYLEARQIWVERGAMS